MILSLILVPAAAGVAAFLIRSSLLLRVLLAAVGLFHIIFTAKAWLIRPQPALGGWLAADAPGLIFLSLVSVLFLAAAVYGAGYLKGEPSGERMDFEEGDLFSNAPEARFVGCLLFFLATMTAACLSRHFGLFWVATEATTLSSAPLIFFHRHHRSLEATWKYLLICSVGIALALLGNSFLAAAGPGLPMDLDGLLAQAARLNRTWLKGAFLLFLIGYGTKMGLAPLHTWLPDAHSESPSLVSALLSGALLNCSFLGILRLQQVLSAAGEAAFGQELLVIFGLMSMGVAAAFVQGQGDYKRMLAYSSVEHMGVLALGVGLGSAGAFGAMLHAVNHSVIKAMLFLVAGNILSVYKTKSALEVRGALRILPLSGALWLAGLLAISGSPPFGAFLSEFVILKAALDQGQILVAVFYLIFLAMVFVGMATTVLGMALGDASRSPHKEGWSRTFPPAILAACSLLLGIHIPEPLRAALKTTAHVVLQQGG
ncbi:MAG: NADH dehydrogenase FAD-containing subunit [Elusimicrobia bacterium]|nr:NADH dehydrogenase FAD-containing subunit [Elusimicrobiota bacterium]